MEPSAANDSYLVMIIVGTILTAALTWLCVSSEKPSTQKSQLNSRSGNDQNSQVSEAVRELQAEQAIGAEERLSVFDFTRLREPLHSRVGSLQKDVK